jgi:putative oxidoreductase
MSDINALASLLGRILLAALFIPAGWSKLAGFADSGTAAYMEQAGVPAILLPLVIAAEIGGGLAVLLGIWSRCAALALAGFTLLAALLFHQFWVDPSQYNAFMKNLAIAGGLLLLFANGPGRYAVRN